MILPTQSHIPAVASHPPVFPPFRLHIGRVDSLPDRQTSADGRALGALTNDKLSVLSAPPYPRHRVVGEVSPATISDSRVR